MKNGAGLYFCVKLMRKRPSQIKIKQIEPVGGPSSAVKNSPNFYDD